MPLFNLSVKHGRTLEEARAKMEEVVREVDGKFAKLIQRVERSADGNAVKVTGTGFQADIRVDPLEVHIRADAPLLGRLLGPSLQDGLTKAVEKGFQMRLTDES